MKSYDTQSNNKLMLQSGMVWKAMTQSGELFYTVCETHVALKKMVVLLTI